MSANTRSKSKSRSNDRKKRGKQETSAKEGMQAEPGFFGEDGQDPNGLASASGGLGAFMDTTGAKDPTELAGTISDDSVDFSEEELLADASDCPDLAGAPAYFLAGMKLQTQQNRKDLKELVGKSRVKTERKMEKISKKVDLTNSSVELLKAANAKLQSEIGDLNEALEAVRQRLDHLEKLEKSGGPRAGSSGASNASTAGTERPLGANRFGGFRPAEQSAGDHVVEGGIDRDRFYGGSHPEMPRQCVVDQILAVIKDYNERGPGRDQGHLVLESYFVPATCTNWWVKMRPSLGATALDQGHKLKKFIFEQKIKPVGAEDGVCLWMQPNRTNDERDVRKIVNSMLSWCHAIRGLLQIPNTYIKAGHPGAVLIRACYQEGREACIWKSTKIGQKNRITDEMEIISDEVLKKAFEDDYLAAGKAFSVSELRAWWGTFLAEKKAKDAARR